MYAQDNILCQFGLINLSSVQQLISQPILIHFWWELYHSSHMMGSEEHVFNKKLIAGSVRTANGAHMKMLCEGDINVDVITKNGDVASGTLRVKVIPGMKQKLFRFTQAMMGGWTMQGGQTKQGQLFIALIHEDHKPIIFDRVLKAGNSVLLAAKMVIKNPEEVNAAIVNGKQPNNTSTE